MRVLNIEVPALMVDRWRDHLAAERQPFFLTDALADRSALGHLPRVPRSTVELSAEERDTYCAWRVSPHLDRVVWVERIWWDDQPAATRRRLLTQQAHHRRGNVPTSHAFTDLLPDLPPGRIWWHREQLTEPVLARSVVEDQLPSRHEGVSAAVWRTASRVLPDARRLAGTFPAGSGSNCFGTVMAAAGVADAEDTWMQREPFEQFLAQRSRPGGNDGQPGTLLIWRTPSGEVEHAAVTLGDGWALHKPAQTWWSARVVVPVRELITWWRTPGQRLRRRRLSP